MDCDWQHLKRICLFSWGEIHCFRVREVCTIQNMHHPTRGQPKPVSLLHSHEPAAAATAAATATVTAVTATAGH